MKIKGKVWKYGPNIDTDAIIPARYLSLSDSQELAKHSLEDLDPQFAKSVQRGDIIVAEANFGCGSSREHAPLAIKAAGISCVIANSFARIFYHNSINIGLPLLECKEAVAATAVGDVLEVDLATGQIINLTKGKIFNAKPYPQDDLDIISAGGLIPYLKATLKSQKSEGD